MQNTHTLGHTSAMNTIACSLDHALRQWEKVSDGKLTPEVLLDVHQYAGFDLLRVQARHQNELNEDPNISFLKTAQECVECGDVATLHSDALGENVETELCSGCWAGGDLKRQLICILMQGHEAKSLTAHCLCCSELFCCVHVYAWQPSSDLYCDPCWYSCRAHYHSNRHSVVLLQRWWRSRASTTVDCLSCNELFCPRTCSRDAACKTM